MTITDIAFRVFIISSCMFGSMAIGYFIGKKEQRELDEIIIKKLRDHIKNLYK